MLEIVVSVLIEVAMTRLEGVAGRLPRGLVAITIAVARGHQYVVACPMGVTFAVLCKSSTGVGGS